MCITSSVSLYIVVYVVRSKVEEHSTFDLAFLQNTTNAG